MQLRSLAVSLNPERSSKSRRSGFETAIVGKCLRVPSVDFDHTDSARYLPKGGNCAPAIGMSKRTSESRCGGLTPISVDLSDGKLKNMMSTRRSSSLNFTMPLVLEPPRHGGLSSIALVPGRHLVGAAADCAIRLQAEGILDRHAMILVGENRTVVKAIDSRTWVNDGPVSEMALRAGDRLSIGPLTFRVRAAAKDELAAFEVRESLESGERSGEQSAQLTLKSNVGEMVPPIAVAATAAIPVSAITNSAATDARRRVPPDGEVIAQPTGTPWAATDRATAPSERSVRANVVDQSGFAASLSPVAQDVTVATLSPEPRVKDTETAAIGLEVSVTEDSALERRLDEIQKRLADLGQSEFSFVPAAEARAARPERGVARDRIESQLEWNARTEQLAREASELQQRIEKVTEREALLEQRQLSLVQEAERIAQVAEMARQSLAEEHAEHFSIWQEWEGTFQRLTSDLAAQLSAFERQRDAFKQETQRFQAAQVELRTARADHERERQTHLADRIKLQNEFADLNSLRSQQDRLHLQCQRDLDEQSIRLEVDRKRLQDERAEIATLKIDLLRQRQVFDLDRSQFDVTRTGMEESLRDLQVRCQLAESDLTQWRQQQHAESTALAQSRENEAAQLRELQTRLDDTQRQLQSEQNAVTQLRRELEIANQVHRSAALPLPNPIALADPTSAVPATDSGFAQEATAVGQCALPAAVANPDMSASAADSGEPCLPISQSADEIWTRGADAARGAARSSDIPRDLNSFESFGVAVDWSALAAIEQTYGQATEFSREGRPLAFGEGRAEAALNEQGHRGPTREESNLPATPAMALAWPEQTIWPSTMTPLESGRIDDQAIITPATTAKPPAQVGQAGDDPWAGFSGSASIVATTFPAASLDEILNAGMGVASEQDSVQSPSDFAEGPFFRHQEAALPTNESQDARQTLAEVNREFGTAVQVPSSNESKTSLPAWWVENTKAESRHDEAISETGKPSWVLDALRGTPADQLPEESKAQPEQPDEPANQLRSQLAKLFELPANTPLEVPDQLAERDSKITPAEALIPHAEVDSDAVPEGASPQVHGEDSVDAFMARLLARSRTGGNDANPSATPPPIANTVAVPAARANPSNEADESASSIPGDLDRSHLMQGPKHKQDRQAVRENLQSFRQVAHLSARSALAKHSLQQLRNATIAKGVLLAASGFATIWFFGEPLLGRSLQLWKGSACALALVLSAMEFSRSWRQLIKPIRPATPSNSDLESADAEASTELSEAATAEVSPKPIMSEANPVAATDATTEPAGE